MGRFLTGKKKEKQVTLIKMSDDGNQSKPKSRKYPKEAGVVHRGHSQRNTVYETKETRL